MNKRKVVVVPHSHWDREWYFSLEDSNVILSQNMNFLLDYLSQHQEFPTYIFDGQYSIMSDFLEKNPEKRQSAQQLITEKRLQIGPWYTQCDTLLNQTESIIRNILLGKSGAEELGYSMKIGYLPDIFGQNSYLPSIFKGFGIEQAVLQRGLYNEQIEGNLNFIWQSPNGDTVEANNIFFGYGPGKFLANNQKYLEQTLLPILDKLADMTPNEGPILLPAGGDQVLVRTHFPKVVAALNQMDLAYEFELSDYENFMAASNFNPENIVKGELIASQKSRIHNTIRSQRVDIKLLNSKVEEKIYQQLEPLGLLTKKLGGQYPQSWINALLKELFDVHSHDSLGGCNSDETNLAIMQRLKKIERTVDGYINIMKKQIARGLVGNGNAVVAFNLLPKAVKKNLNFVVFTRKPSVALVENNQRLSQTVIKQDYISGGRQVKVTAEGEKEVEIPGYYRTEILAAITFEGFGYKRLDIAEDEVQQLENSQISSITNNHYQITYDTGRIILTRLSDGHRKLNWFDFEDTNDVGDSYDYSPDGNTPVFSNDFTLIKTETSALISRMFLKNTLRDQEILTTLTLEADSNLIKIEHHINNKLKDHRVRVRFHGETQAGASYADQGYSLQKRLNINSHLDTWREEKFAESPQAIYPLERFVAVPETDGSVSLYTKGLKEYEATSESLKLTLFRSVGLLGRDDLSWRPGRASGINNKVVETPDAQMQGDLVFSYAYKWAEKMDVLEDYESAEEFASHQLTYHLQTLNSFEERLERFELPQPESMTNLPADITLLTLPSHVFVSSMKKAEQNEYGIIRVFNPQKQKVSLGEVYHTVSLEEAPASECSEIQSQSFENLYVKLFFK